MYVHYHYYYAMILYILYTHGGTNKGAAKRYYDMSLSTGVRIADRDAIIVIFVFGRRSVLQFN